MLGVDYVSSTYVHLVEVLYWQELLSMDAKASYPALKRPELGEYWDGTGQLHRGRVGQADCRLFRIDDYVEGLLAEVKRDPSRYVRCD